MNIDCLIIEDSQEARTLLEETLATHFPQLSLRVAASAKDARTQLTKARPQLLISDIDLGDALVFEVLSEFPQLDCPTIFTTSHNQYAIDAFSFSAIDYLLKPYDPERLIAMVQKCIDEQLQSQFYQQLEVLFHNLKADQKQQRIVLKNHDLIHVVALNTILYAQADSNYTHFFCEDRKILVSGSLKSYESQLSAQQFFRCHHSYLINLNKVKALHKSGDAVILLDDSSIPVASSKKKILYQLIG